MIYNSSSINSANNGLASTFFQPINFPAQQNQSINFEASRAIEKVFESIDESALQQLQYDGEDLFFNQPELSHHNEESFFGSHISCDHFHDQEDEDFHHFFALDLSHQISQQIPQNSPQLPSNAAVSNFNETNKNSSNENCNMNFQSSMNGNNVNQGMTPSNSNPSFSQILQNSQSSQQNFKQNQNTIISQNQQQCQQKQQYPIQYYQQQQQKLIGNAVAASNFGKMTNNYENSNSKGNMSQQISSSQYSQSSSSIFSQPCQNVFSSQQRQVQYVAPSNVNYYKLYETQNNNLVNQQKQVKGNYNNGNNRQYQNLQQNCQTVQQKPQQVINQQQLFYQAYQQPQLAIQQQQVPQFTQIYQEQSFCDNQVSSILNFTENCCNDTTTDMHHDDYQSQCRYSCQQETNSSQKDEMIFEFFGHENEEEQINQDHEQIQQDEQIQPIQQEQQQQFQEQTFQINQICNNKSELINNLTSMSSSHTLPINCYEQQKHISDDEHECSNHEFSNNHDFSNHHEDDDAERDSDMSSHNKAHSSMELIADNPDFYTEQRKDQITDAMQKSNKKNVVRNLMRAFKQYFLNRKTSEQIMKLFFRNQNAKDVQQRFKRYFSQRKFNHHSIKQLVQHEKYGVVFHQFLKEHSQAYLKNSSVKMQELHQVFIDFLLLCFRDIDLLDNLETYSKIKNPFQ